MAFEDLLRLARERAMAGDDSDLEFAQLLDRHAQALDSFDWCTQILVYHSR